MSHLSLLTRLLVLCSLNHAASEVYYVTANSIERCTVQPCLTLSQFTANYSHYHHSNTTLVFLPGTHYLSKVNLTLSNADNFMMKSEKSTAQIKCTNDSSMHFSQSQCIHITSLEFTGCGSNRVRHVEEFVVKDTKFKGQENSGTTLELIETTAQIVNSTFVSNRRGKYRKCVIFDPDFGCMSDGLIGGAIIATNSTVHISQSKFEDNGADSGGAIFAERYSTINMSGNVFIINNATFLGGVLHSHSSSVTIKACQFHNNAASGGAISYMYPFYVPVTSGEITLGIPITSAGGVLFCNISTITIETSEFHDNSVTDKGVMGSLSSILTIEASKFHNNRATRGGVLYSIGSYITIETSEFHDNSAWTYGGVLCSYSSNITIETSEFHDNSAINGGGVLYSSISSTIKIGGSKFTKNHSPIGAIIHGRESSKIQFYNSLLFDNNMADRYAVIYLSGSEIIAHNSENAITFSNNAGSIVAFNSNITFTDYAVILFVNNQPPQTASGDFQEGGAITLLQSNVFFDGVCSLEHNHAENGGAIHSTESKLYVNGNVTIAHNTAARNGGGVYLSTSELNCQQKSTFELFNNTAVHKGGGLHARISSTIKVTSSSYYTGARINFTGNVAKRGGGLSLEANAKLYIQKYNKVDYGYYDNNLVMTTAYNITIFSANSADYGGAVYVDDDTNSGTCASDTKTECFFQVLALYYGRNTLRRIQSMHFSQNYANISGSSLYGGLLDRCAVSQFAEVNSEYTQNEGDGVAYFKNVSTPIYYTYNSLGVIETEIDTNLSVSSDPVRMCLCISTDQNNDCTYQSHTEVKKGQTFTLSVVAVDQIGQPVSAIIQTSLQFSKSGLAEGQLARKIRAECTNLTFNVVSPHNSENLSLYASDGPCKDADLSRATVEIHFLPCSCPIGLQVSGMNSTNCACECHSDISQYMDHCDGHSGLLVKMNQSRAWISYINDTYLTGYLVYPNCPFDYCLPTSTPINLNQPDGADVQCIFNRSSLLCGSCQPGLSLSLGSSHCLPCPSYWPALLTAITIAAILAGIALVASLLVFNMTVAVGTLNGLIFYANIVYVNKNILLPFQKTNFITVFISWLNLELGIDTCFFPGLDTYTKTWLQLAFPAYVFFLVVIVIIISSYSTKFSNQIGKKDPVATLATLVLLSYAKLLEICFKSLSVGILEYPDGSSATLWLPDATVRYLSGKHILLFIAAVLILLLGLVYTALLFSWQWLLYLPRWRIFRWSRNPKIQTFIETYHKPYTPKHRYWTGLLLIVRIILYLVAAVNISNDPTVALTAISFTVCCIFTLSKLFGGRLYRKWPIDVLETFFYLNILSFATFTWYSLDNTDSNQEAAAYTSVIITFIVLLLIILYYVYTYTTVFSKAKKTKLGRMIDRLFTDADPKPKPAHHWSPPPDDDIHRFNELLDVIDCPVNTYDYEVPVKRQEPAKPTQSVVEVHQPRDLAAPDPEEVANTQHILGDAEAVLVKVNEAVSQL